MARLQGLAKFLDDTVAETGPGSFVAPLHHVFSYLLDQSQTWDWIAPFVLKLPSDYTMSKPARGLPGPVDPGPLLRE